MENNEMFLTEKTKRFFKQLKSGITEIDNVEFLKSGEAVTVLVDGKKIFEYYFTEEKEFDYSGDDYDYNFGGPKVNYITTEHQNYYFVTGDKLISTKRGEEPATRLFVPENIVFYEDGIDYPINPKIKNSKKIPFRVINGNLCYAGQYSNIFQIVLNKNDTINFTIDGKTVDIKFIREGKDFMESLVEEANAVLRIIRSAYSYFDYYKIVENQENLLAIEQFNYGIEKLADQAVIKVKTN